MNSLIEQCTFGTLCSNVCRLSSDTVVGIEGKEEWCTYSLLPSADLTYVKVNLVHEFSFPIAHNACFRAEKKTVEDAINLSAIWVLEPTRRWSIHFDFLREDLSECLLS